MVERNKNALKILAMEPMLNKLNASARLRVF